MVRPPPNPHDLTAYLRQLFDDPDVEQLPIPFHLTDEAPHPLHPLGLPKPTPDGVPIYLPTWRKNSRGVPNAALRGALFPAIHGKDRRYVNNEIIRTQADIQIAFTGYQFDQADLNVWETCLHLSRRHPLGNICEFNAHAFLIMVGRKQGKTNRAGTPSWSFGKKDYEWLRQSLGRLTSGVVSITHADVEYFGTLIHGGLRHLPSGNYRIMLNPDLIVLYNKGWSAVNWKQRHALARKPLALWLHGYFTSHQRPYPIKTSTLRDMSGSTTRHLPRFTTNLRYALDALKDVGAITDYSITRGLVRVHKP